MSFPFTAMELPAADARVERLFRKSFHSAPPDYPRHFVAVTRDGAHVGGYIHYTTFEPGVFLLGGLCIDSAIYRVIDRGDRAAIAEHGSLSRWLIARAAELLGPRRAIFAHTGSIASRRDGDALGFVEAVPPHLIVWWHDEPLEARARTVEQVRCLGAF